MDKKVAYIDGKEWNRHVIKFVRIIWVNILVVELLLFAMYKPVPECSRIEYFRYFILYPSGVQLIVIGILDILNKFFADKLGEKHLTICMIIGEFILSGVLVQAHSSVDFMCMVLVYPLILTSVYRKTYIKYFATILCVGIYAMIQLELLPGNSFKPQNSNLVYVIIFAAFTVATVYCVNLLTSVVVDVDVKNQFLQRQNERMLEDNKKDAMTKLYHHKAFYDLLNEQVIEKKDEMFSVIMIDIDDFKSINDQYGHAIGDRVILDIVTMILQNIRKNDQAARYGGEEFAILLPRTPIDSAFEVAERIRKKCEEHRIEEVDRQVTLSIGVVESGLGKESSTEIFKAADEALYLAKKNGKNQTICR